MSENLKFKDLVKLGQATATSQIHFYVECERYRRGKAYEKDGFKTWTDSLNGLLKRIRRSRSGVMAKLAQVRLLLDSNKVSFEQLEKIGDANATMLCRLYRTKGLNTAWIKRAMTWEVERFKAAVLKVVKPKEEPRRRLTFVLNQSMFVEVESMIGRIQTLAKLKTREGALEFIVADYVTKDDAEILHQASENPDVVERLVRAQQAEQNSGSKSKASKSQSSKNGSRSRALTQKPERKKSRRSASASMPSDSETSSPASPETESISSSAVPEPTTQSVN